jgi:hypothetical protein
VRSALLTALACLAVLPGCGAEGKDAEGLADEARGYVEAGIRHVKIKVGRTTDTPMNPLVNMEAPEFATVTFSEDLRRVGAVRKAVGDEVRYVFGVRNTGGTAQPATQVTLQSPFYVELKEGAEAAAEAAGHELIFVDANGDVSKQNDDIQDLITRGVDILILNPVNPEAVIPSIEAASEAGIPVITVDRPVASGAVTHIGRDLERPCTHRDDFRRDRRGCLTVDLGHDHVVAVSSKPKGGGTANATPSACHNRDLPVHVIAHKSPPLGNRMPNGQPSKDDITAKLRPQLAPAGLPHPGLV